MVLPVKLRIALQLLIVRSGQLFDGDFYWLLEFNVFRSSDENHFRAARGARTHNTTDRTNIMLC